MDSDLDVEEDERAMEVGILLSIWPEIQVQGNDDDDARNNTVENHTQPSRLLTSATLGFELEIPVKPPQPVTLLFQGPASDPSTAEPQRPAARVDPLQVTHLPSVKLTMHFPPGYPRSAPPRVKLSTTTPWLARDTIDGLEAMAAQLWDEGEQEQMAFTYIDHLHRAAEDVFDVVSAYGTLTVDASHKHDFLANDIKLKRAEFLRKTYECGICLEVKKGFSCHEMNDCGHVFCLECLRTFYTEAIQEGNISSIKCAVPDCARRREAAMMEAASNAQGRRLRRNPKTLLKPRELLQMGLLETIVRRFVDLKYKVKLEADKTTIYCPRPWCSGAARSQKRRKPSDHNWWADSSDDSSGADSEAEEDKGKQPASFDPADLLSVCEDCNFAFCCRCLQTWHGEFVRCKALHRDGEELNEEEKASVEYLRKHTSPCPTCDAPVQKIQGCNHMTCSRCQTHFCYLCSAWLDGSNPYKHFNRQPDGTENACYLRLWERHAPEDNYAGPADEVAVGDPVAPGDGFGACGGVGDVDSDDDDDDEDSEDDDEGDNDSSQDSGDGDGSDADTADEEHELPPARLPVHPPANPMGEPADVRQDEVMERHAVNGRLEYPFHTDDFFIRLIQRIQEQMQEITRRMQPLRDRNRRRLQQLRRELHLRDLELARQEEMQRREQRFWQQDMLYQLRRQQETQPLRRLYGAGRDPDKAHLEQYADALAERLGLVGGQREELTDRGGQPSRLDLAVAESDWSYHMFGPRPPRELLRICFGPQDEGHLVVCMMMPFEVDGGADSAPEELSQSSQPTPLPLGPHERDDEELGGLGID